MNTCEPLRAEIESTRSTFHRLLNSIPEEVSSLPSGNPAWNIRQVLYHIAIIPRYVIVEVVMIRKQVWLYQLLPRLIPKALFYWLNACLTRFGARGLTRQRLAKIYDQSCRAALKALNTVPEEDFGMSLFFRLLGSAVNGRCDA